MKFFAVPKKKTKFWEFVFAFFSRNECILRELIFAVRKKPVYFNLTLRNDTKIIFFVEHQSFALKSPICLIVHSLIRPQSRPFVGCDYRIQSSTLNFEKNIFIRNGQNMCRKNMHPSPPIYRIGPVTYSVTEKLLSFDYLTNQEWMTGNSKSTRMKK